MAQQMTGYPSIDKPWLKYYGEEAINAPLPDGSIYNYLKERNNKRTEETAIIYFGNKISYEQLFEKVDLCAKALLAMGVKKGDFVSICISIASIDGAFSVIPRIMRPYRDGACADNLFVLKSKAQELFVSLSVYTVQGG